MTLLEVQKAEHAKYMEQRGAKLFGRQSEIDGVMAYVKEAFPTGNKAPLLIVSGAAGNGKSSLLAHVAGKLARDTASKKTKVVAHFIGATSDSTSLHRMISRLWHECLEMPEDQIPSDADELKRSLEILFQRTSEKASAAGANYDRVVVLIDALNQLDDDGESLKLHWLPRNVPHNLRLIVSTLDGGLLDELHKSQHREIRVESLDSSARKLMIEKLFEKHERKLTEKQLETLLQHTDAGCPLWLALACEELRSFDEGKPVKLADSLHGLIRDVIERVISESSDISGMVSAAFCLISASRFGLLESELLELLVIQPSLPLDSKWMSVKSEHSSIDAKAQKLPQELWNRIKEKLKRFLRPMADSAIDRLDFYHRSFSKVLKSMTQSDSSSKLFWHRRLADYFEKKTNEKQADFSRLAEELPFQLQQLEESSRLRKVLGDDRIFDQLYKESTKFQLLAYCRSACDYSTIAHDYLELFQETWPQSWFPQHITETLKDDRSVRQWASKIRSVSAQNKEHKASNLIGFRRVYPGYGDYNLTWSNSSRGSSDSVELEFEKRIFITEVVVFETYHSGAVKQIDALDPSGQWQTLYKTDKVTNIEQARKFSPDLNRPTFKTNVIRISVEASACNDFVHIDAVQLAGTTTFRPVLPAPKKTQKLELRKQWVSKVTAFSSQYGEDSWSAQQVIGPSDLYPTYGDNERAWAPKTTGTSEEYIEVEFDRAVYPAAVCILETFNAGGVKKILAKNQGDQWTPIYSTPAVECIKKSRKFFPPIDRPKFPTKSLRIEVDQTAAEKDWVEIDAVALYGYDEFVDESICPIELIKREIDDEEVEEKYRDVSAQFPNIDIGPMEHALASLSDESFLKCLRTGIKVGWFLIDLGEFAVAERQLAFLKLVSQAKQELLDASDDDKTIAKVSAEVYYALVILYRNWFTKFVHASNPESRRASALGKKIAAICYEMHKRYYGEEGGRLGDVMAACSYFVVAYRDETIELLTSKNHNRGLVDLYSLKGTQTQYESIEVTRSHHEKAIKLAYSEFGKFHIKTARAHQLYGQMLWNRWAKFEEEQNSERMQELYVHYATEYEIFENLFGPNHPLTIRSREDNIIVLRRLDREQDAAELEKKQPIEAEVLGNV